MDLSGVEVIEADRRFIKQAHKDVESQAQKMLEQGMETQVQEMLEQGVETQVQEESDSLHRVGLHVNGFHVWRKSVCLLDFEVPLK